MQGKLTPARIIHRSLSYRLEPTHAQAAQLEQFVGVCRFVYNLAWEQRETFWRQYKAVEGRSLSFFGQTAELTLLRREVDWIGAVPIDCQLKALRDLDQAYISFFAGRSGRPTPRKKGVNDGIAFRGREVSVKRLNAKWAAIRIPRVGYVKARWTRDLGGEIRTIRVTRSPQGWLVAVQVRQQIAEAAAAVGTIGIDRGVAQTLSLSNGEVIQAPDLARLALRKGMAQRRLARCTRGSKRRAAQRREVGRLASIAARARTDWCHRASTSIARRFGLVAIEDLNITGMTASGKRKRSLNRSILEQCWGKFATQLAYKLEERGGTLISVPAAYTSQTCSACGVVDRESRKSQAVFACVHCGHTMNADWNAALEILRRSTVLMGVEGAGASPMKRQPGPRSKPASPGMLTQQGGGS